MSEHARRSTGADATWGWTLAVVGLVAAALPSLAMWGFTVDDALISQRYAQHLAAGEGYRFNIGGDVTDGVTPLPWAFLLAPLVHGVDLVGGLARAKALGVLAWSASAWTLGRHLGVRVRSSARAMQRRGWSGAVAALVVLSVAFPVGAWAASGMETGLATALATLAATWFATPRRASIAAGLVACLRPELVVWAMVVAAGSALANVGAMAAETSDASSTGPRVRRSLTCVGLSLLPFALSACARVVAFGRPTPLALVAKPSDASHGLVYAAAATVVVLTPALVLAPVALRRASPMAKVLAAAALAHVVVVVVVGGDWMPYARLMVPIAPSLAVVFLDLVVTGAMHPISALARVGIALSLGGRLAMTGAPAGRHVHADRQELIAKARPVLGPSRVVAALDIGWVAAAARPDATVVDLAGLTDPSIAMLPGGHTSKRVDMGMLLERDVDTIVVYSDPRRVELALVRSPLFVARFERLDDLAFGSRGASYTVYRRR